MSDRFDDITSVRLRWCTWSEIRPIIMKKTWHLTEERANSSRAFLLMIVRICLLSNLGVELEVYWQYRILTSVSTLSKLTVISTRVLISALHPYQLPGMFAYSFQSGFWYFIHYCPQTKIAKVMFLHVSVCPQGVVSQHALQVVSQHALQVSRGISRPTPRGKLRGLPRGGSPGPHLGGLHAHTQEVSRPTPGGSPGPHLGGVSRPTPRGVYPSMHWGRPPADGYCRGQYASYWNAFLFNY